MQSPNNLRVMAEAEELAYLTYRATANFPPDERFGLVSQMRRAAISIGSNIVEGCDRHGNPTLIQFLQTALGSAGELRFQLRVARRLGFGGDDELAELADKADKVHRMLVRLITALRARSQ